MTEENVNCLLQSLHDQGLSIDFNQIEYIHKGSELYLVHVSHDNLKRMTNMVVELDWAASCPPYATAVLDLPFCLSDFPELVYSR